MLAHNTITPDVETASDDYARRFSGPVGDYLLGVQRQYVRAAFSALGCTTGAKVLEVGGGHAQLTKAFLESGYKVCVQGSEASALGRIKQLELSLSPALTHVESSLWQLPFADREFDVVVAVRLLAHVEKWTELLAEMARVARLGVVVDFASLSALNRLAPIFFGAKRKLEGNTRPFFSYTHGQIADQLKKLGLRTCYAHGQLLFPMALHRGLKSPIVSRALEGLGDVIGLREAFGSPVIMAARRAL
ncbi:MAG: methyltransferase domain-containing protein [Oligoflexia bacterium]|nr:methyltransferase domain-containing protein [Oligoflexia bacterium]